MASPDFWTKFGLPTCFVTVRIRVLDVPVVYRSTPSTVMKKISISARILPQWDQELTQVMETTGQTRSQVLEDAIAQYLKKTRRAKHITRIEALERRVEAIAALVVKR
jgi:predicted transcriptional regulator